MDCCRPIVVGLVLALTPAAWAQTDTTEAQRVLEIVESGYGVLIPLEGALAPPESESAADPLLDQFEEAEEITSSEEMVETEDEMSDDVSAMVETADADDAETMAEMVVDDVDTTVVEVINEAAVTEEMASVETTTLPEPPAADAVDSRTVELGDPELIGPYLLWLGSFRNMSEAQEGWDQLAKDHPDILGSLVPILVFKYLGTEEGTFFRFQAGPLQSEGEANDTCAALQAAPSFCTVLGP
ncbi:MAG: SPOR domain-containing protein [Rhodospirillales bacterium]|nr:SPOR domain-containing protein [Rhodospirillales bacterium]